MMNLNVIEYLSKPGNIINEDCIYFGKTFGMVLDGSTGLRKNIIPDAESDAKWFVEGFRDCMVKNIDAKLPLSEIVKLCIREMRTRLIEYNLGEIDKVDQPSASLSMVRKTDDYVELFSLGDCTTLIETVDDKIIRIHDDSVSKLDNEVITKMIHLKEEKNISILSAKKLVEKDIIKNRYMKNTANGYWILGFDEEAVNNAYCKKWNLKDLKSIYILCDGFAEVYESMNIAYDYIEFIKMLKESNVESMYSKLRTEQEIDYECNIHPRMKRKDDASILVLKINNLN